MTTILGIKLNNRMETSQDFQTILSKYGCIIKTRLGLHETNDNVCNSHGIIILEITESGEKEHLISELKSIKDIKTEIMEL